MVWAGERSRSRRGTGWHFRSAQTRTSSRRGTRRPPTISRAVPGHGDGAVGGVHLSVLFPADDGRERACTRGSIILIL